MEKDEKKLSPVQEPSNQKSDKKKNDKTAHDINISRSIIKQKLKLDTARYFTPIATITEKERKQFTQSSSEHSYNALLAEKARNAIKIAENHVKEEAIKREKINKEKAVKSIEASFGLAEEIKVGNFEIGFGALTEGFKNLQKII